jgi:hypothetical protein
MLADSKSHGTLLLLIDALRALVLCVEHGRPLKAPNVSDEQMKCAGAAAKEYLTADAAFARRATANGVMSVDDTIAQRRLAEDFCKQWAACLVSSITDASSRETALRATFAGCLTNEAKDNG